MTTEICSCCSNETWPHDLYQPQGNLGRSICISCAGRALEAIILEGEWPKWDWETLRQVRLVLKAIGFPKYQGSG